MFGEGLTALFSLGPDSTELERRRAEAAGVTLGIALSTWWKSNVKDG